MRSEDDLGYGSTRGEPEVTKSNKKMAVVGAGWLGAEIARRAADAGFSAIATTRSGEWRAAGPHPDGVEVVGFDIVSDSASRLQSLLRDIDVAVFCYAPSGDQDRGRLYVEGAKSIARACSALPLERVIYTSSTSALSAHDGWIDETSEDWPENPRGRVQREAEAALRDGLSDSDTPWTLLRLAGLYGPGRELERIYRVRDPDLVRPGDGLEATNLIHLDDAAGAVLAAMGLPASDRGVIHVCDDDHRTRREVVAAIAAATGAPEPKWAEPADSRTARGKRVVNTRMKERLGLTLKHPTHDL